MANTQKCVAGTAASNDALLVVVNKALACPFVGTHVGGGRHVSMPATWDKYGDTPPGWTKQRVANYVLNSSTSQLPISDALVTELLLPASQARLSAGEISTLNTAIAARANFDTSTVNYVPKVGPVLFVEGEALVIVLTGQSCQRSDADGSGPYPTNVTYWNYEAIGSTAFAPMDATTGSKDLQIARSLASAGRYAVIMNFAYSATTSADWMPPSGVAWSAFETSFNAALALLSGALAGRTPRWIRSHDQGEKNVSDAGGQAAALLWAEDEAARRAAIESLAGVSMPHIITLTRDPQPTNYWIAIVRSEETTAAGDSDHLINRDDVATRVDGIHPTHPLGERDYGTRQVAKILPFFPAP